MATVKTFEELDVWQKARVLPPPINSTALDFNQSVTPDGRWLYFSSTRPNPKPWGTRFDFPRADSVMQGVGDGTKGDIYRVPLANIFPL